MAKMLQQVLTTFQSALYLMMLHCDLLTYCLCLQLLVAESKPVPWDCVVTD